jgi:methylaspartate mutase sigma subunit
MTATPQTLPLSGGRQPTSYLANARRPLRTVVSSTKSDSHAWNLIYIELVLRELGHHVTNLGACVPEALLVRECRSLRPDLVVISTVNGHGTRDGSVLAPAVREDPELAGVPLVIGGQLTTSGSVSPDEVALLRARGFDAVFGDGDIGAFQAFVNRVSMGAVR